MATAILFLLLVPRPGAAQVDGHASVMFDALPDLDVTELRIRIFAERHDEFGEHLRINIAGYVDGLLAERVAADLKEGPYRNTDATRDAIVRPADLYIDIVTPHFDLRAGAARLVWGRLDEFQPTDVVNPIDLSRFVMEGRSEARLPVGLVRARVFLPKSTTLEAVAVPHFRRGRFDQLDEPSSPFNLTRSNGTPEGGALQSVALTEAIPRVRDEPASGTESLQGGVRLTSTTARVDWSCLSLPRDPSVSDLELTTPVEADLKVGPDEMTSFVIRESFPRFTMIGADFETVRGVWGVRGEVAAFVDDELQSVRAVQGVAGRSLTAGIGVDRKAGDYRIAANALWSWSGVDDGPPFDSLMLAQGKSRAHSTETTKSNERTYPSSSRQTGRSRARRGRFAYSPSTTRPRRRPSRASSAPSACAITSGSRDPQACSPARRSTSSAGSHAVISLTLG